jgi:glycine hydroxymethyltransferase
MATIVDLIDAVLADPENENSLARIKSQVNELMKNKPLFKG